MKVPVATAPAVSAPTRGAREPGAPSGADNGDEARTARADAEIERLRALHASGMLLDRPQAALDALARAAATLCGVSVGLVNFLDESTQLTAASAGFAERGFALVMPRSESVCQHTIEDPDRLTVIGDLAVDTRAGCQDIAEAGLRFYAGANVLTEDRVSLGVVCVLDDEPRELSESQLKGLSDLATVAAALIEQHGLARQLVAVADRLGREAGTDPLTGLYNRRALEPVLANLPPSTALAMVDLDHFKALNDRAGHDGGDRALRGYGELFREGLRDGDVAARWGGEEFVLVLANSREPRQVLDRLRRRAHDADLPVTFSAGLTAAGLGEDPHALIGRADQLLYRAKELGRDRVVDDLA